MDAILTIHSVDESGSVLSIAPAELERLIETLAENDVTFTSVGEMCTPGEGSGHRVALTFDDGLASVHRHALPLMDRMGVTGTVYVVTDWVGLDNRWPGQSSIAPRFALMGWSQIEELRDAGIEIGSHTRNHVRLPGLDEQACESELGRARRDLEDRLQCPVEHFAYPYGAHDEASAANVGRWYRSAVTTRMGYRRDNADLLRLPRLDTYYLRESRGRSPVFGLLSRARLHARSVLRRVRRLGGD